jgi:hypothetical protein
MHNGPDHPESMVLKEGVTVVASVRELSNTYPVMT